MNMRIYQALSSGSAHDWSSAGTATDWQPVNYVYVYPEAPRVPAKPIIPEFEWLRNRVKEMCWKGVN